MCTDLHNLRAILFLQMQARIKETHQAGQTTSKELILQLKFLTLTLIKRALFMFVRQLTVFQTFQSLHYSMAPFAQQLLQAHLIMLLQMLFPRGVAPNAQVDIYRIADAGDDNCAYCTVDAVLAALNHIIN